MKQMKSLALLLLLAMVACNSSEDPTRTELCATAQLDCGENAHCTESAGGAICECDEEFVGAQCQYLSSAVLEEFADAPDPTEWSRDPGTGRAFRYTTAAEREANGWNPGTFLVESTAAIEGFSESEPEIELVVPLTATRTRPLKLVWNTSDTGQEFVEIGAGAPGADPVRTSSPLFNLYASKFEPTAEGRDLDGAVMVAVGVARKPGFISMGYVERQGALGTAVDRLKVSGPGQSWVLDTVPGANLEGSQLLAVSWSPNEVPMETMAEGPADDLCGFPLPNADDPNNPNNHPCSGGSGGGGGGNAPQPADQCSNVADDDGDSFVDVDGFQGGQGTTEPDAMCLHHESCAPGNGRPFHTHRKESGLDYGLFGSVLWCTRNRDTWEADMYARAAFTNDVFHQSVVAGAEGDGNPLYNEFLQRTNGQVMRWRASKCWMLPSVDEAQACKDNANACGPFAPGSQHEYPYGGLSNPRANYSNYITASYRDLEHAVKLSLPHKAIEFPLDLWQIVTDESGNNKTWGGTADDRHGVVVNGAQLNAGLPHPYRPSPHEFGHVFGCEHCDADYVDKEGGGLFPKGYSIMVTGNKDDACYHGNNSSERAMRFGTACSLRIVSESVNRLNSRYGAAGGPSFGF